MDSDLIARADAAAARGLMYEAMTLIGQAIAGGQADFDTLLKAASLYRANAEPHKALGAVEQALAMEPLNFFALFMRAFILDQLGDPAAPAAYGDALSQRSSVTIPTAMMAAVERAEEIFERYKAVATTKFEDAMAPVLDRASPLERKRLERFASNKAMVTRPYHCEPIEDHFPGLPEYEFHDRSFFPWIEELEAATDVIRDEALALMKAEGAELVPYVQYHDTIPMRQWKALNNNLDWTAIHLLKSGERVEKNAHLAPTTLKLLEKIGQPQIPGASPNAMFSVLAPNTHIPPHYGIANFRLVCHLPLIVPRDCWFRVGATRHEWKEGELIVFDDTIEHEAMNGSDELRVVLIFDAWHPALTELEREGIALAVAKVTSRPQAL